MRRLGLFALTLAGACGASTGSTLGGPCDAMSFCNKGEVCDYTADGGPICITGEGDLDGDGIPNAMDFCEHQAGGATDEDQDGIGDDCDRCPIAAPPSSPDSDGDAVDSPCDPDPHTAGDEILLFENFAAPTLDAKWKPTTASVWKVQGGEVIATAPASGPQDYLTAVIAGKNNIAIEASWRVDKIDTSVTPVQHLVELYMKDPRPAGVASMACGTSRTEGGTGDLVLVETNQGVMSYGVQDAFNTGALYRAGGYVSGVSAGCSVIANGKPLGAVQAAITADQLSSIAISAKAATVRFQYVLIVGH